MAWYGYVTYDGTEIINVDRTETYVDSHNTTWGLKEHYGSGAMEAILGTTYQSPLVDDAPWTDGDRMESFDFWGVYPLNIEGLEDSSRESTVTEYTRDGGNPGRLRHNTKSVVFSVALMGASEAATEYGFHWLKAALLGRVCAPNATGRCFGRDLTYFSSEPIIDPNAADLPDTSAPVLAKLDGGYNITVEDPATPVVDGGTPSTVFTNNFDGGTPSTTFPIILSAPYPEPFVANPIIPNPDPTGCLTNLQRHLKDVQVNQGPTITAKRYLTDGSVIWTVQFTAVAGDPFEYGRERIIVDGFLDGEVVDPFGPDVDGPYDSVGYALTDAACPPPSWEPIYDPLCPALVPPPGPVDIPAGCFDPVDEWWRRFLSIPDNFVPLWGQSVPVIGVLAQFADLRQVRLRIYADQTGAGDPEADQCAVIGDLMISYVPQGMTLIIDGARQSVYVRDLDGVFRRADSLVFSSDGKPIVWPELTCGYGYLVTVDTLNAGVVPAVDVSVVAKVP